MLTKLNHLSAVGLVNPQKASDLMIELQAFKRGGHTLEALLSKLPVKTFQDDTEYYWNVVGSAKKNVPLVEARTLAGDAVTTATTGNIGANGECFYLVFAEDYFAKGEVIFGNLNQVYPIRILNNDSAIKFEGTNTVYTCELMGGIIEGIPAERLLAGERFSVGFAPVSKELSRKAGDIRFATPVAMRNEWTTIRLQHKVSGAMLNRKLSVGIPVIDENGKKDVKGMWMHYVDWAFETQWADYKNTALAWGTSNRTVDGQYLNYDPSGEVIRMGDGLFAQMEAGNVIYYSDFSLKLIEDALYDLFAGRTDFAQRKVVLRTGERGAALFNKSVRDTVSGWVNFTINGDAVGVVKKTSSPLHQTALAAGYQFTEYQAPNGLVISVEVDPFYDDPTHNKQIHPLGGLASSYRFDIMDLGSTNEPNIVKCAIEGVGEIRGYEAGLRNPFTGDANVNYMGTDEDASTIHKMTTFGVAVFDPTRTMSIIPNVLV